VTRVDVISIFPQLFDAHLSTGLLGKAIAQRMLEVAVHDLREHGSGKHRSVDDEPYGGGAGMVIRPEPIFAAVEEIRREGSSVVLLSARGERLTDEVIGQLLEQDQVVLICGRYEGVDERVAEHLADREVSLGDFVLHGGEVAALAVIEALSRYVPGVLGNRESLDFESYSSGLLEYPQYTRPAEFRGYRVPDVLLSGDHAAVERWRQEQAETITRARRPDMLDEKKDGT
jgi:tRNA (guanine37-N1)-methyltransferase